MLKSNAKMLEISVINLMRFKISAYHVVLFLQKKEEINMVVIFNI